VQRNTIIFGIIYVVSSSSERSTLAVVVTADEIARIFSSCEALGNIEEAAKSDEAMPDIQKAAVLAGLGNVLAKLRQAQRGAGAKVLYTPNDPRAARLQSLVSSGEAAKLSLQPLPSGGFEAVFDTDDWAGWATVAWAKLTHFTKHPLQVPGSLHPSKLQDRVRVGLLGDWGTGMYGAPKIAESIKADPDEFGTMIEVRS